jgi:signal transduction histidine kinase
MNKQLVFSKLKTIFFILVSLFSILFFSWLAAWETYLGYLGLLILFFGIVFWRLKGIKFLYASLFSLFIFTGVLFPQSLNRYNQKTDEYMNKIETGQGLNFKEKASIYGLNFFMSVLAYPIYPEVSKESFYLMFNTEDGTRVFEDDFFMGSQKIRDAIKNKNSRVAWRGSEYLMGNKESRYALALNPCNLDAKEFEDYSEVSVEVQVAYPEKYRAVLLKVPFEIAVEEGLFHYLQEEKWLHPYKAIWKATVGK